MKHLFISIFSFILWDQSSLQPHVANFLLKAFERDCPGMHRKILNGGGISYWKEAMRIYSLKVSPSFSLFALGSLL